MLRVGSMIGLALALVVLASLYKLYPRYAQTGVYRTTYEGIIIDKSATFHETQFGSWIERQLIIKEADGNTFPVVVGRELYERALVGMWIKKQGEKVDLSWPGPRASPTSLSSK